MKKKNYLITGITGFAGAHLANLLHEEGHNVYGLIRGSNGMETDILDVVPTDSFKHFNFIYGDLTDQQAMNAIFQQVRFDGCFHLAAQSHPPTSLLYPLDTFRVNIMGSANLIDAIQNYQPECKLMFCSTSEVYGNSGQDGGLLKETDLLVPSNPYAASKAATDLYMQERMTNGKIKGFITRAFSHTGPRRGKNFSISADAYQVALIMKGLNDPSVRGLEHPAIEVGNLETTRVVLDVRCIVRAYYLLMINPGSEGKIFNVCGDTPRKMAFFTDKLISLSKMNIEKNISEKYFRKIDIYYQHGDTSALTALTGWCPEISIEQTMEDLLNYWLKKLS